MVILEFANPWVVKVKQDEVFFQLPGARGFSLESQWSVPKSIQQTLQTVQYYLLGSLFQGRPCRGG